MAVLRIPDEGIRIEDIRLIRNFLKDREIFFAQWEVRESMPTNSSQEDILQAYSENLKPLMDARGYTTADVINIHAGTENYPAVRAKFLAEHTHTEDEVRFFVEGFGDFWFHLDHGSIFVVRCEAGDLIGVPAGVRHWFDAGKKDPNVKAIRMFTNESGWVPDYTGSDISRGYV